MRLKKLELYGFKSFAQRTEIVFGEGITGIVGPNGSGKSNIGDAVRWVLGEQSAKTLRGASMSDVIFNGTQKRKPLSYCEVSLVFDNEDRALPMDFAEIMVTRRVYRNGESEYYLNRATCRLKDIIDLLRDTGIGKEGYSIIGQGRIDEILSRKSEDRRQVFEEAAGIVKFKARKEEADKKLQSTLENAERVDNVLAELKRHLGPLEEQSRAARQYMELSAELKGLDLNLFLLRSDRAGAHLAELDEELMALSAVLRDMEQALSEKTARRDAMQADATRLEEEINAAREELTRCTASVHEAQTRLSAVVSRRDTRRENRQSVLQEQQSAVERLSDLEERFRNSRESIQAQEQRVAEAEKALRQARRGQQQTEQAAAQAGEALEKHKTAVMDAMNRLSAVRNDQTRLKTMRSQMAQRLDELLAAQETLQAQEQELTQAVDQAARQIDEEKRLCQQAGEELYRRRQANSEAERSFEAQREQAQQLSARLQSSASRHALLTEMTRDMEGYNGAVKRAVQYARQQRIPGVHGVLAQLLSVPQQYETAIDMALGAAEQNIVTDREETAKELIQYLRQNHLGRATFLPMTSVRSKTLSDRERQALRLPGCLGVASELVGCEEQYRDIVENLLGRTVIADNLEHGIAIMRAGNHAFRLVTLEGDVMHSGGSMTGGSTQSKMVNLLSRERELKELTEQLTEGKRELEERKRQLAAMQERMTDYRQGVTAAIEAYHQQEIAVTREQSREMAARQELEGHRTRMEQQRQAAAQLQDSLEDIDRQLESIGQQSGDAQLDQAAMEARTEELQQAQTEARQQASDAAEHVMACTLALSDLRHELDSLHREQSLFDADQAQLHADQARREGQLADMDALDAADAQEIERLTRQAAERQAEQEQREQAVQSLEGERIKTQQSLSELTDEMEGLHQALSRDGEGRHRVELARAKVENELRTLQNRIWDTYELTYAGAEEFRQAEGFDEKAAERRVSALQGSIRALGNVNVNAVEEYAATKARYDEMSSQQEDLRRAEGDLRELIERLLRQMETTFVESFTKLQGFFSETFTRLFGGGHAELRLMDPSDPLNCGIEVNAQPPGKKLQLLSLLSGGERALTAIAILFAMLKLKPTPFCILDEIEAALDDANIGYYADYLQEYSRETQFIVVTHRKGTMERCNSLFGVAMEEQGVSKMVSVSLQDYQE